MTPILGQLTIDLIDNRLDSSNIKIIMVEDYLESPFDDESESLAFGISLGVISGLSVCKEITESV